MVGHRDGSDPVLLWLWCRPVAAAPIGPLAWEATYASGAALKRRAHTHTHTHTHTHIRKNITKKTKPKPYLLYAASVTQYPELDSLGNYPSQA